jgi:RHS repeat-associated protein
VTDRLGSVRANTNGERFAYFPYGEERTNTADNREKFGTYFRDPSSIGPGYQDYADQRYYGVGSGRFYTPDPSSDSWDSANPGSWNSYAYAGADPINFYDPDGLAASNCGDSHLDYNGYDIGTISQVLKLDANITILAKTEFTEAGHSSGPDSHAEEDLIGEVIMNRWALVNGYYYLFPTAGRPPLNVTADWGSPGGGIDSVTQNGQFAVWDGSSLTTSAQNNWNGALGSAFNSRLCNDLAWAIGSAISFISSPTVNLYADLSTGLIPLAFNSGNFRVPGYMQEIGSLGDSNVFYGAPQGDFSANLMPLPRPRPVRPTKPPSKPGRAKGGPIQVQ